MDTEQNEINTAVEEAILENAQAFITTDAAVDSIMAWAENEIIEREKVITDAGGSIEDFKKAAEEIEAEVARRLQVLESETREKFPPSSDE